MEQFLTLIILAALSLISSYLNKRAEKEQQQEEPKRLHERAANNSQRQQEVGSAQEPQQSSAQRKADSDEANTPSPIRKFWEDLNEATRELTEPFEQRTATAERQGPSRMPSTPPAIQSDASDETRKALEIAREQKKKAAEELRKKKKNAPNPWAFNARRKTLKGETARAWLKFPATTRQAFAASVILSPPKALKEEDDQWFSR